MATPKRITKEQAEVNKEKQQVLRQAGYNIKVDGDYNTLFGISPSKVYEKLKELGYKISDFELE